MKIIAHAIEYLSDESYYHGRSVLDRGAELEAIEILMARNREIYLSCPTVSTFGEWLRKLVHVEPGQGGNAAKELVR